MLTAEAEKRVREIAREAAEKAVLDNRVSEGKKSDLSGDITYLIGANTTLANRVAQLEEEVKYLIGANTSLATRVVDLECEVKNLQKEVDDLKSDVSSVLK